MNSTNQLEECMDVSYATFLVPIQEGLNKRYVVQQLLAHAGDYLCVHTSGSKIAFTGVTTKVFAKHFEVLPD